MPAVDAPLQMRSLERRDLCDSGLWKGHKQLPRSNTIRLKGSPNTDRVRFFSLPNGHMSSGVSGHDDVLQKPTLPPNVSEKGLPPTPPSNSADGETQTTAPESPVSREEAPAAPSIRSQVNTPVNQRSPPTPDTTPPRTREQLVFAGPLTPTAPYLSSRAESFQTAREDQWSSDGANSPKYSPLIDQGSSEWLSLSKPVYLNELGHEVRHDETDGDITPTERNPRHVGTPDRRKKIERQTAIIGQSPGDEWDPHLMRNVTVRRRRPRAEQAATPLKQPTNTTTKTTNHTGTPEMRRPRQDENQPRSPTSADSERRLRDITWPSAASEILQARLRNSDAKRLSSASSTSTIVEAIVVDTTPQRRRTLRHAGKNLALRSTSTPVPGSNRNSLIPQTSEDGVVPRRLHHQNKRIPEQRQSISIDSEVSTSPTTSPQKAKRESINVVVLPQQRSSLQSAENPLVSEDGGQRNSLHSVSQSRPSTAADGPQGYFDLPKRRQLSESAARRLEDYKEKRQSEVSVPDEVAPSPYQPAAVEEDPLAMATAAAIMAADATQQPVAVADEIPARSTAVDTSPKREREVEFLTPASPRRHQRAVSEDGTIDIPRMSFDMPRASFDSQHAMARHVHAQVTPFSQASQFSDSPDTLEVSQATAVSIFPHNNNSLLVVQHIARSAESSQRQTMASSSNSTMQTSQTAQEFLTAPQTPPQQSAPLLTVEPSTPPQKPNSNAQVDSPLKNPRQAPEPPAFKIIPPTPNDELDRQLVPVDAAASPNAPEAVNHGKTQAPARRQSLIQRARRYSDTFIQPLFARNPRPKAAHQRHHSQHPPHIPSVADRDASDSHLHPFWRPQRFWDDLSDTESLDSLDSLADDRLPAGGDTSNEPPPPANRNFLFGLPGFRGEGGFLIGNSLGLDRAGTNRRRHYVALPASFKRRFSLSKRNTVGPVMSGGIRKQPSVPSLRVNDQPYNANQPPRRSTPSLPATASASYASLPSSYHSSRRRARKGRKMIIPGLGLQVQYIGLRGLQQKIRERSEKREEKKKEERREILRRSIGHRVFVEDARVV